MVVTSRPFFDPSAGFLYNDQSLAMILSPLAMALGCYLAVSAYLEGQRFMQDPMFENDFREDGLAGLFNPRPQGAQAGGAINYGAALPEDGNTDARVQPAARHFQGKSYKLGAGNA